MIPNTDYIRSLLNGISAKLSKAQAQLTTQLNGAVSTLQKAIKTSEKTARETTEAAIESAMSDQDRQQEIEHQSLAIDYGIPLLRASWVNGAPHIDVPFGGSLYNGFTFRVIFDSTYTRNASDLWINGKSYPLRSILFSGGQYAQTGMGSQGPGICYLITYTDGVCYAHMINKIRATALLFESAHRGKYVAVSKSSNYVSLRSSSEVFSDIMPAVTTADNGKILKVVDGAWAVVDA